jgi:branched-chain amino acid transport system substrate-binding protein
VSQKVFGVMAATSLFFGAYRYAAQTGVPVVGAGVDGAGEWGNPKYSNLFGMAGGQTSNFPTYTTVGKLFKARGATKVALVGYGSIPQSSGTVRAMTASIKLAGLEEPYVNLSVPLGGVNMSAIALGIKQSGADGLETQLNTASNVALLSALRNAGVKVKVSFVSQGYSQALLNDPTTLAAARGYQFTAATAPWQLNTAGTKEFQSAMKKYAGYDSPNPQQAHIYGWFTTSLMIRGLKEAGPNPTWKSFSSGLSKVNDYTANGLLGQSVDFTKGQYYDVNGAANCVFLTTVIDKEFKLAAAEPYCGEQVPGTKNG